MQPSREREDDTDVDSLVDEDILDDDLLDDSKTNQSGNPVATAAERSTGEASSTSPLIGVDGRLFSGKKALVALVLIGFGMFFGGMIPIVGGVGRFVGLFFGAFAVGLLFSERRYVETGLVGSGAAATTMLTGVLGSAFLPVGVQVLREYGIGLTIAAAVIGLVVALLGHYFGRDLRAGLVKDLG